jgi:NADPH:quinone reductase
LLGRSDEPQLEESEMKAVRMIPGAQGASLVVEDIPQPALPSGQVMVRVRASGLNRGEIAYAQIHRSGDPVTNGVEFAGEVAAVGVGVTQWREGDRVMGHGRFCQAQYTVADPLALMRVPEAMSFVEAAAFPNVFITAHDAVVTNGQLRAGEAILVNGASGGVATAAIQVASLLDASAIIATSRSAAKLERLREFGANVLLDVTRDSQLDVVMAATDKRGVDVVIDTIGGTVFDQNVKSLAVKGRLVHIARLGSNTAQIDLTDFWLKRLRLIGVTFRTRTEQERLECVQACARDLLPFLEAGRIKLPVDRTFAMDDVVAAYAYMKLDQHVGKLVLMVD